MSSAGYAPLYQETETPFLQDGAASTAHSPSLNVAKSNECIQVKAKYHRRYKSLVIPASSEITDLVSCLKESFHVEHEGGASVGTAYLLWILFGFAGVHRFYLRQHNACSWTLWLLTGQLFGFGWLYDGAMLWSYVEQYNKRVLFPSSVPQEKEKGFIHFMFGFKEFERPSMVAAYLLWFFCGFVGIHRWYTGYCTPASFMAWICTGQMFGLGWLYDGYYTAHMVDTYKVPSKIQPFYIKAHDGKHDYMPVNTNEALSDAINKAFLTEDRVLRITVVDRKEDGIAYVVWLLFGWCGAHAWYLGMPPSSYIVRALTGNYFILGFIVEGIRLDDLIEEANTKIAGDYLPSYEGSKSWPLTGVIVEGSAGMCR
jgi:TM2 domain-containing membrane protein YozV